MKYVYILKSVSCAETYYTGVTGDLRERLAKHNSGGVAHTSKHAPWALKPWALKTYIAFSSAEKAIAFEKYLKSPSGRAFAKKRL